MNQIVTLGMIVELNQQVAEQAPGFRIHLSDACGRQSMWIEQTDPQASPTRCEGLVNLLEAYFHARGMTLGFSQDNKTFWIAN